MYCLTYDTLIQSTSSYDDMVHTTFAGTEQGPPEGHLSKVTWDGGKPYSSRQFTKPQI